MSNHLKELPKGSVILDKSEEEGMDVEKASSDVHLHNDTIDSLYWDRVSVKVKAKTNDKHLLTAIDGAASAGESNMIPTTPISVHCHSGRTSPTIIDRIQVILLP
jgi:hypothetical protein